MEDTGPGVAPEHRRHLGERFYRADTSRNRATGGADLGLSVAQSIARAHGGTIRIESEPGSETRTTFSIPATAV